MTARRIEGWEQRFDAATSCSRFAKRRTASRIRSVWSICEARSARPAAAAEKIARENGFPEIAPAYAQRGAARRAWHIQ